MDVLVIGDGATGAATLYDLARRELSGEYRIRCLEILLVILREHCVIQHSNQNEVSLEQLYTNQP